MKPIDPRLLQRSAVVRRHLGFSIVLGTVTALLIVAQAWLVATLISRGFDGLGVGGAIAGTLVGAAVVFGLRAIVSWLHEVAATRAAVKVKSQLRIELSEAIFDPRRVGPVPETSHLVVLFGSGLNALDAYFAKYLPQLVLAITVPLIVGVAVLWSDPIAAIIIAVTLPLIVVFMILVGWLTKEKTERRWAALKRLSHHFFDVLDGLVVLKIFGRSQVDGLTQVGEQHRKQSMAALKLAFLSSLVMELFAMLAVALVAVSVGLRVVEDQMDLQTAMFVLLLAPEAFLPMRQVGAHFHDSAEGVAAAQDAFDVLDGTDRRTGTAMPGSLRHS
ncbi:MAG TPA: ABC transporter transmembrane domain-containing protein, partial [Aeromicrobium sp.]|nr:ABC transporter transmembrane domain-containing protein [Aeromicrobium sp.]